MISDYKNQVTTQAPEKKDTSLSNLAGTHLLNSLSLASASKTREAPIKLERAAERVAANTPRVMRGA